MRTCLLLLTIFFLFVFISTTHAVTVYVPDNFLTIQAAIDACADGDSVIVRDGTYTGDGNRDIDFLGKAIVVMSENGPDVTIINCQDAGRGFYFHNGEESTSVVQGFKIKNGYDDYSGGIRCDSSSPMIIKCTFSANEASRYHGGGMHIGNSHPTVTNCLFIGNSANHSGGGMYNFNSNTTVTNCTFIGNSADFAGGLENSLCDNPTVTNCLFIGNSANGTGGGMYNDGSNTMIINCTFTENSAINAGGMRNSYCSPTVTNCILWNDSPDEISGSAPVVRYSDVEGGHIGEGNIDVDPRFVSYYGFDYFLRPQSPCVDKSDPAIEDFIYDWHPRWPEWYPNHSRSDMGAYGGPGNVGWLK